MSDGKLNREGLEDALLLVVGDASYGSCGWHAEQRIRAHIAALEAERDAARDLANMGERFKAYVHKRLDEAGVPTHPDGPHSKVGCRIGDRLDIVLTERDAAYARGVAAAGTKHGTEGADMSDETKSSLNNLAFALATPSLTFCAGNSEWLFRIVYEGNGAARVELNEGVTWDEAGKLFWETVERLRPAQNTAQGVDRVSRIS